MFFSSTLSFLSRFTGSRRDAAKKSTSCPTTATASNVSHLATVDVYDPFRSGGVYAPGDEFSVPPELDEGRFVWDERDIINSGTVSTVFQGQITHNNKTKPCAIKSTPKYSKETGRPITTSTSELAILRSLDPHPNVVKLYNHHETPGAVKLALELGECSLGELLDRNNDDISTVRALHIIANILQGLDHLHKSGVLHLDIKRDNVILRNGITDDVFLAGFGTSVPLNSEGEYQTTGIPGTLGFAAPEVLKREPITEKADVFSAGVLAYRILTGRALVSTVTIADAVLNTLGLDLDAAFSAPRCSRSLASGVEDILRRMLHSNPHCRPTSEQALVAVHQLLGGCSEAESVSSRYSQESYCSLAASVGVEADGGERASSWAMAPARASSTLLGMYAGERASFARTETDDGHESVDSTQWYGSTSCYSGSSKTASVYLDRPTGEIAVDGTDAATERRRRPHLKTGSVKKAIRKATKLFRGRS